jgi:hypothetical protein
MIRLRRTLLAVLVWLTAATTLVAGVPHFDCLCPNGDRKPFCLGLASKATSCCCGGACCGTGGGASCCQAQASCCSHHKATSAKRPSNKHYQIGRTGCQRSLVLTLCAAVTPGRPTTDEGFPALRLAAVPAPAVLSVLPIRGTWLLTWRHYRLPPPPDLIVTLQHFLI